MTTNLSPLLARLSSLLLALCALVLSGPATAQSTPAGKAALAILQEAIAVPTVAGRGQVPALAAKLEARLIAAGFADADVVFTPMGETGYLTARYRGRDAKLKPIILLGHMDVVEANRADWERDPFVPVIENGYIFGRGAVDNKADISLIVATLMKLKRSGWTPSRDLVLALTGDEETEMKTTQAMAEALKGAEMVLNGDAGGGTLDEQGRPTVYGFQAAEKVYADYRLTVTDEGGHSSRPDDSNAIAILTAALNRIAAHRFPAEINPITKAYLEASAPRNPGPLGEAMRAYAGNPAEGPAAAALSANPEFVGQVRTTCVVTQISGGHAPNALPQTATANVNCRIFPGTRRAQIEATLNELAADPRVKIAFRDNGTIESEASPLRDDVVRAVTAAVWARVPGIPVMPSMSAGATDAMHFRARGVPSYGVGAVFIRGEDDFAHGLNERLPLATLDPGVAQWEAMLRAIAK